MTPDPDPEPTAAADDDAEEVFENRAARRAKERQAKSKGSPRQAPPEGQAPPDGKGHVGAGRGSVQGPRQWGNRRSG